jgi:hypothetical protein
MKIGMAERYSKDPETGEENWSVPWDTNLDSLQEAVVFAESIGHVVRNAYLDFGGTPCVLMEILATQSQCLFFGNYGDRPWFNALRGLCGATYTPEDDFYCTLPEGHEGRKHEDHDICPPEVWAWDIEEEL